MIKELQIKHREWAEWNFPNAVSDDALIGIMEEMGELAHAHLKAKQGIRGTPEQHRLDKMDAVGDIFMYLLHYCTLEGINIDDECPCILLECEDADEALLCMAEEFGILCYAHMNHFGKNCKIRNITRCIDTYCMIENFDRDQILQDTWTEISQRDWLKNRGNGVTE